VIDKIDDRGGDVKLLRNCRNDNLLHVYYYVTTVCGFAAKWLLRSFGRFVTSSKGPVFTSEITLLRGFSSDPPEKYTCPQKAGIWKKPATPQRRRDGVGAHLHLLDPSGPLD
jgi:hypothetical protein